MVPLLHTFDSETTNTYGGHLDKPVHKHTRRTVVLIVEKNNTKQKTYNGRWMTNLNTTPCYHQHYFFRGDSI